MTDFVSTIRPSGNVYIVTVPAQYIKDGHLIVGEKYRFSAEVENAE